MRKVQVKKHKINGAVRLSVHKEVLVSRIKSLMLLSKSRKATALLHFLTSA